MDQRENLDEVSTRCSTKTWDLTKPNISCHPRRALAWHDDTKLGQTQFVKSVVRSAVQRERLIPINFEFPIKSYKDMETVYILDHYQCSSFMPQKI